MNSGDSRIKGSEIASLVYKNHRIIISTAPHRYTNRWIWSVVVSWSEDDRPKVRPIKNWLQQFDSKQDAEGCAIKATKTWIDKRLELDSSVPR